MEKKTPDSATDVIRATVPLVSGEAEPHELLGDLVFDPADPYAVQLVVAASGTPSVTWSFARELLADGLYDPTGDGDVLVWPCLATNGHAVVVIELHSPHGMAMLQTPSRAVHQFVEATYEAVPAGAEAAHLDVDGLVAHLLAD